MSAHPDCTNGHVCAVPSGRICVEPDCEAAAGTKWGPFWCPPHDQERLERVAGQLRQLQVELMDRSPS